MTTIDINDFTEEKTCTYKGEIYSVRDNGAIMRHSKVDGRMRKNDDVWTLGKCDAKNFMRIDKEKVNRIVTTAFCGVPLTDQYVVFHKNYNTKDNRACNLQWVTKFEYQIFQQNIQSQLRIVTGKRIEEILSNISILQSFDIENLNWMQGITQKEANECLKKYRELKFATRSEKEQIDWHSSENKEAKKKLNYHVSLTPRAVVAENMLPSYFPCCPQEICEKPLESYYEKLKSGNVYYMNKIYKTIVKETVLYENSIILKCESGDGKNAVKPWSISTIIYENDVFVHSLYRTCFQEISADKYFTILQGKKWTDGDVFDDFC